MAMVEFENGAMGTIFATTNAYPELDMGTSIFGSGGSIETIENRLTVFKMKTDEDGTLEKRMCGLEGHDYPFAERDRVSGYHGMQIKDFIDAVREGRAVPISGREGRKSVEIILAAYKSAREGRPIELPLKED